MYVMYIHGGLPYRDSIGHQPFGGRCPITPPLSLLSTFSTGMAHQGIQGTDVQKCCAFCYFYFVAFVNQNYLMRYAFLHILRKNLQSILGQGRSITDVTVSGTKLGQALWTFWGLIVCLIFFWRLNNFQEINIFFSIGLCNFAQLTGTRRIC